MNIIALAGVCLSVIVLFAMLIVFYGFLECRNKRTAFCKCCGTKLKMDTFPLGFFDNYVEFKEGEFIGNFYCIGCARERELKHKCESRMTKSEKKRGK